ncbi:NEL-type E3 ubiquitin ligase domain-containing protein [Pseudomonas sp. LB3P25]
MSSISANQTIPVLTPEQQGVFLELVRKNVPAWLLAASAELRRELHESLVASHRSKTETASLLKSLKSPQAFCTPLLAKAMSDKLGTPLDVAGVVFQHVRSTSSLLGLRKKLVLPIDRDLLTAACENFEASETLEGNYHDSSLIYIPEKVTGKTNRILSIKPHEFATLCRSLDLGKQYQTHLQSLFNPKSKVNALRDKCISHSQNCFEVDRHLALMKKHISADVHQMLKAVRNNEQPIRLGSNTLGYQSLKMFDVTLTGAMFIGPVSEHDDDDYRCMVYLPGDPLHPLKEYSSFSDFEKELSARLKGANFRKFFMRYIKLGDRSVFLDALDSNLISRKSSPLPASTVYVSLSGVDVKGDMFEELFRQYSNQVMADARLLVVPTDDEDEKTRLARLETWKTVGLNLLLTAASFLPVVGEVLLVVTGAQLLSQVYEGIASWSRGEQEQAMDYLFDTVENLILMAAFAAGTAGAHSAYKTIRTSAFIERLRTVTLGDSLTCLWNPDLTAYHQSRSLPATSVPDDRGLHRVDGQAYLSISTKLYAVQPRPETDLWEVLHPNGAVGRYLPLLETNGRGAWRHDSELPQEWDRLMLFRRFGYTRDDLSDVTATQILAVSGIENSVLRQAHIDRSSPPALLIDTVRRFRADAVVNRFIEQIQTPSSVSLADPDLQLFLLVGLRRWPADTGVSVDDAAGQPVSFHGSSSAQAAKTLKLSQTSLDNGQLHTALLSALSSEQREHLVGLSTTDRNVEIKELTKILAEEAQRQRLALFTRIYQRTETPGNAREAVLLEKFTDLPASMAEELVGNALSAEWEELDVARVPLRLAEEARRYLQVMRVSRAYEGLYMNSAASIDTDRLVLHTLEHLPGWSANLQVQILEWSGKQNEVVSIGSEPATEKLVINAHGDRYSVFDGKDGPLTSFLNRTREHYFQALWHGLPASRKTALGVQTDDAGAALRQKITQLALERRAAITQLIGAAGRPGYRSPMGLADRSMTEHSAVPSGSTATASSTDVLVQRARELYPMHSPAQIHRLLTALGTNEILVLKKLESLRLEFFAIREALGRWVNRQTWHQAPDGPRLEVSKLSKFRAAQAIIRSWRKESGFVQTSEGLYSALTFAPQPLGELPVIVGDFSHIGSLVMEGVGASAGLNTFLHNFSNLQSLSLSGNHLDRLPLAVTSMPRLAHLNLNDNRIQLTAESASQLAGMTGLRTLNLSYNPKLSRVPDVSKLRHLQQLNLRGTGIDQWPAGASDLSNLRVLDMRDNRIERLPEEFFKDSLALNRETNLHGNPVSPETVKQIIAYQQKNGVSFGVIASDYRRQVAPTATQEAKSALWLAGKSLAESVPKRALWDSLLACPGSRDFFNVISRLRDTADFKRLYPQFSQRVWDVLEAAGEDDRLRRSLFSVARTGRVSVDGYSALFSEMEVQVLCFRAMAAATTGSATLERQFINLLRGLFRLQEVEGLALVDINTRTGSQPKLYDHALQISLAYRVGLAERLDLPAQPREMAIRLDVEVSPAALDRACQAVLKTERTSALQEWIVTQGFWVEYLEAAHRDRFAAITDRTAQGFAQLEGQVELTRVVASERMTAILHNFRNERRELIKQLTSQALVRNPAPEVPGTSTSTSTSEAAQ